MKILITSNGHQHYGRTGVIVRRDSDAYVVRIPDKRGTIQTLVREKQFKDITPEHWNG